MVIGRPLFTVAQIRERVTELGNKISYDYSGREILAIGILKGAFMFYSDLVRAIGRRITTDFLVASSYKDTESTCNLDIHYNIREDIKGRHVLLVDDIIDTGLSLNAIREKILEREPASLKMAVFLDKKERRKIDIPVDYVGYEIPNEFVVGYGLDYENQFRNLPYIAVFKKKT
jgi:hypoxanthine phosphoribosyltransferase